MKAKYTIVLYCLLWLSWVVADEIYLWSPSLRYRFPTLTYQNKIYANGEIKADMPIKAVNIIASTSQDKKQNYTTTLYFLDGSNKQQAVFKTEIPVNPTFSIMTIQIVRENNSIYERTYILPISCTAKSYENFTEIKKSQLIREHIRCVQFSKDGRYLLVGSDDGIARILDPWTLKTLKTFRGHLGSVRQVLITRDNKTLVSCSMDKTIRIWDIATEKCTSVLTDKEFGIQAIALSPDEQYLASSSRYILIWDFPGKKFVAKWTLSYFMDIQQLAFTPDGRRLLSGDDRGSIRAWKVPDGYYDHYVYSDTSVVALTICPSLRYMYSGDKYCNIKWWQLQMDPYNYAWEYEGKIWELRVNLGKDDKQEDADDYKAFFNKIKKATVYTVYDADDLDVDMPYNSFDQGGAIVSMQLNSTGEFLMFACRDGEVRIHETVTAMRKWGVTLNKVLSSAAFSENGMMVAIASAQGMIWVYGIQQ